MKIGLGLGLGSRIIGAALPVVNGVLAAGAQPATFSGAGLVADPRTILAGMTLPWIVDLAQPGTLVSGKVHIAPDQSGNGRNFTAGGADLTYSAAGGPNSNPYCQTNTTSNYLSNAAYTSPTPGTTPTFHYGIYRLDAWVLNSGFTIGSTAAHFAIVGSTSGKFRAFNGVNSSELAVANGTWLRIFCQFNNSATNDRLRIGAADTGTGTSFGNSASGAGKFLMVGSAFSAMSMCYAFEALGVPSAGQITALDAWATRRFSGATF